MNDTVQQDIFEMLNFTTPSWGAVIGIFFFIIMLLLGLILKRNQIVFLLLSTYITLLLFYVFPGIMKDFEWMWLKNTSFFPFIKSFLFFILTFILFFLFSRSIAKTAVASSQSIFVNVLLVALWLGLFLSVLLSFAIVPERGIVVGSVAENIFLGKYAQFSWMLLSLLGMVLIKGPKKRYRQSLQEQEDEE